MKVIMVEKFSNLISLIDHIYILEQWPLPMQRAQKETKS